METNTKEALMPTNHACQEGYNFNNCSNCTINFYAEGKAVDVLMKKEENSERKMAMVSGVISPLMAMMAALSKPSEPDQAFTGRPVRNRRKPSVSKRNNSAKKAPVKKSSTKKKK